MKEYIELKKVEVEALQKAERKAQTISQRENTQKLIALNLELIMLAEAAHNQFELVAPFVLNPIDAEKVPNVPPTINQGKKVAAKKAAKKIEPAK